MRPNAKQIPEVKIFYVTSALLLLLFNKDIQFTFWSMASIFETGCCRQPYFILKIHLLVLVFRYHKTDHDKIDPLAS